MPKGLHEPDKRPSDKECASFGYACLMKTKGHTGKPRENLAKVVVETTVGEGCCTSLPMGKCGQSEPKIFMDSDKNVTEA